MNADQREAVRQEVIRWIQSGDFASWLNSVHFDPRQLPSAFLRSFFRGGGLWPWDVISHAGQLGFATSAMRRRYLHLAQTGRVAYGFICELQSPPVGREPCMPATLIAGIGGSTEDDELAESCLAMIDATIAHAQDPKLRSARIAGSPGRVFRAGKSPFDYGDPPSLYVFNAFLPEPLPPPARSQAGLFCLVNPKCWPAVLPIPNALIKTFLPFTPEPPVIEEWPEQWEKDFPLAQAASVKYLENRIRNARRAFYDSLDLVDLVEVTHSLAASFKTIELDAVIAAREGNVEELKRILARGVSPNLQGLVDNAVTTGNTKVVELLLSSGADPNRQLDGAGTTYLHEAALHNQPAIVELLLAGGADPNRKTAQGSTALAYARERMPERAAVVRLLQPVTKVERINYRVDDLLAMADHVEAYYALCSAIRSGDWRELTPGELRVLSLAKFMTNCWPNYFVDMYWQANWAVVPCLELMEAIDEPVFAGLLRECIAIVREYCRRISRESFNPDAEYVDLDEETEARLKSPALCFHQHDYDEAALCRKTMDYVRRNRELFV